MSTKYGYSNELKARRLMADLRSAVAVSISQLTIPVSSAFKRSEMDTDVLYVFFS